MKLLSSILVPTTLKKFTNRPPSIANRFLPVSARRSNSQGVKTRLELARNFGALL